MNIEGAVVHEGERDVGKAASHVEARADESFGLFYEEEFSTVLTAARAFSGSQDAALEATQEAFSRAFARWNRLRSHEWVRGWVISTALNLCRRQGRAHRWPASLLRRPEAIPELDTERLDVLDALRALPPRQRQAAVLFYISDLPVEHVATVMGISEGAVKAHLSRARDALRAQLEET